MCGCRGFSFMHKKPEVLTVEPRRAYTDAKTALLQSADSPDAVTRVHAIEALAGTLGNSEGAVYREALRDENPALRYAAAMAIGDTRYAAALDDLLAMAKQGAGERDKRVYCAVIYALYRLGNDESCRDLAGLLFDKEPEVRMDAAMVMGRIGEPSAMGPLKTVLTNEQNDGVKLQIVESLALLGDSRSAELLEAYTKGYFLDLRLAAVPALARSGSPRAGQVLRELTAPRNPARVRVAAAGELARMGAAAEADYELCKEALLDTETMLRESSKRSRRNVDNNASSLKRLAAMSLGWMKRDTAVNILHPLLTGSDEGVRAAAAMSILRLLWAYRPPPIAAATTAPAATGGTPEAPAELPRLHTAGAKD